jgi:general secretion pathway protein I
MKRQKGFTLLEVLVATLIMSIAITGLLSALSSTTRNAARLTDYDRATLLGKSKMDELLVDQHIQRNVPMAGSFDPAQVGDLAAGWKATVTPFEHAPGAGPGMWVLDRVELEIWWMTGLASAPTRHTFTLEGFRRSLLQPGDLPPGAP